MCLTASPSKSSLHSRVYCVGSRHHSHRHTLTHTFANVVVAGVWGCICLWWEQFQSSAAASLRKWLWFANMAMWKRDEGDSSKWKILRWVMELLGLFMQLLAVLDQYKSLLDAIFCQLAHGSLVHVPLQPMAWAHRRTQGTFSEMGWGGGKRSARGCWAAEKADSICVCDLGWVIPLL